MNAGGDNLCLDAENDSGGNPNNCGDNVQVQDSTAPSSQKWNIDGSYSQCS